MTNHPNRNKSALLLNHGIEIARAILADGSLTLTGESFHDGGVVVRQRAALMAVETAIRTYNSGDHDQTTVVYIEADRLRQNLREGLAVLVSRLKD